MVFTFGCGIYAKKLWKLRGLALLIKFNALYLMHGRKTKTTGE